MKVCGSAVLNDGRCIYDVGKNEYCSKDKVP